MYLRGALAEAHQLTTIRALAEERVVVAILALLQIDAALAESARVHGASDRMLPVTTPITISPDQSAAAALLQRIQPANVKGRRDVTITNSQFLH